MIKLTPAQVFNASHSSFKVLWMDDRLRVYLADRELKKGEPKGFRKRVRIHLKVDMKPGQVFYREDLETKTKITDEPTQFSDICWPEED